MGEGIPYDPADPPAEPPFGCTDPMLWRVAVALHQAHRPRSDGFCGCKSFWPCADTALSERAMHLAFDRASSRSRTRTVNFGRWSA
jgi:hypothetical protein